MKNLDKSIKLFIISGLILFNLFLLFALASMNISYNLVFYLQEIFTLIYMIGIGCFIVGIIILLIDLIKILINEWKKLKNINDSK